MLGAGWLTGAAPGEGEVAWLTTPLLSAGSLGVAAAGAEEAACCDSLMSRAYIPSVLAAVLVLTGTVGDGTTGGGSAAAAAGAIPAGASAELCAGPLYKPAL